MTNNSSQWVLQVVPNGNVVVIPNGNVVVVSNRTQEVYKEINLKRRNLERKKSKKNKAFGKSIPKDPQFS